MEQKIGRNELQDGIGVLIGSFIVAVGYQVFYLPNDIVSGGVTGLGTIFNGLLGINPSIIILAINIPLLVLCYVLLGRETLLKTLLGAFALPFFIGLISHWGPWTEDLFLASLFGGLVSGAGMGLVFHFGGSTGGTNIITKVLDEYFDISLGVGTLLSDIFIILLGVLVFSVDVILYGVVSLIATSYAIDLVQIGGKNEKNIFIVSDKPEEIMQDIFNELERSVTVIDAKGGYSGTEREMLMCVIDGREFRILRDIVLKYDEDAFIIVTSASEVHGRGFSLSKNYIEDE